MHKIKVKAEMGKQKCWVFLTDKLTGITNFNSVEIQVP